MTTSIAQKRATSGDKGDVRSSPGKNRDDESAHGGAPGPAEAGNPTSRSVP